MDWTRGSNIGHGTSATVSIATSRLTKQVFAVKSTELSKSKCLQREQEILSKLDCLHIVGYRGYDIRMEDGKSMFNLMMEYASKGTIYSRGIVHCDIKGSNVLLDDMSCAKIADFGCSKLVVDDDQAVIGGTPMFMAPEVARGEEQGFPADIWALGCMIIEMSTGHAPWPNEPSTLHRLAYSGESPKIPDFLSDECKDFLDKCLRVEARERWTAEELLTHSFMEEGFRFAHVKQGQEFLTDSPTSILDGGIWSSIEEDRSDAASSNEISPANYVGSSHVTMQLTH